MFKHFQLEINRFELEFLICLLILLNSTIGHDHFYLDNHHTEKQMSLESCLGRFDVHGNTIIRTGESQAIGGKFLQGLELDTPEKCQRLCCETLDCDVYVFEEKNDGYCYLFQCGSPKNFHCKFTRHSNYTSALLTQFKTIITTTPRPTNHISLTNISTQERELINLKAKPVKYPTAYTTPTILPVENENRLLAPEPVERHNLSCGRFEFPCHSGECIAVYNACNGIPQCVDGSDEGPECSDAINNKSNNNLHENPKPEVVHDLPTFEQNLKKLEKLKPIDSKDLETSHFTGINYESYLLSKSDKEQNILNLDSSDGKFDQNQRAIHTQHPDVKHSFPIPQKGEKKVHIFNQNSKWPIELRHQYNIVTNEPPYLTRDQPIANGVSNGYKQFLQENDEKVKENFNSQNQNSDVKSRIKDKSTFVQKDSEYVEYSEKTTTHKNNESTPKRLEMSRTASSVKKATHPAFVEQYRVMEQHLEIKFTDHDGHSEKPRGAVLSLTLGLTVTGVIVFLIGCRLKTMGRRRNRHVGKVPYAPDEDFLVNGMYL